jgi:asparagine N-glycosylation enzyme membrane subunit Stt3
MQINIDRKTGVLGGIIVALVAVIIGMSLSSNVDHDTMGMGH